MFQEFISIWRNLAPAKKFIALFLLVLLIIFIYLALHYSFSENRQVLFSDLREQDAANIVSELDKQKIPYKLEKNGTTILVDEDILYKTRLKLMSSNIPLQGAVGFEIFNNAEFGMTDFAQRINYQRAMQGELARTIMGFEQIKSARVHLVLPENSLFKKSASKPKASVSIVMKSVHNLDQDQVAGIQKLVASSVPEISSSDVVVVDQKGAVISKKQSSEALEFDINERLETKKLIEGYIAKKIDNVLDKFSGPGRAIVSVDVALNYDQIKTLKEIVLPLPETHGQNVGAVTKRRETRHAVSDPIADEITNFESNATKSMEIGQSSSAEFDYINSRKVEQVMASQGNIIKLNVGVLLPSGYEPNVVLKLKEMISVVAGINSGRGDGLVVHTLDILDSATEDKALEDSVYETGRVDDYLDRRHAGRAKNSASDKFVNSLFGYSVLAVLLLILILFFIKKPIASSNAKLSNEEREKLLEQINYWLNNQRELEDASL